MFGSDLGHFTILFWEFGTKMNEDDEKCKSRDWFASLLNFYVQKCKSSHHAKVEKKNKNAQSWCHVIKSNKKSDT